MQRSKMQICCPAMGMLPKVIGEVRASFTRKVTQWFSITSNLHMQNFISCMLMTLVDSCRNLQKFSGVAGTSSGPALSYSYSPYAKSPKTSLSIHYPAFTLCRPPVKMCRHGIGSLMTQRTAAADSSSNKISTYPQTALNIRVSLQHNPPVGTAWSKHSHLQPYIASFLALTSLIRAPFFFILFKVNVKHTEFSLMYNMSSMNYVYAFRALNTSLSRLQKMFMYMGNTPQFCISSLQKYISRRNDSTSSFAIDIYSCIYTTYILNQVIIIYFSSTLSKTYLLFPHFKAFKLLQL